MKFSVASPGTVLPPSPPQPPKPPRLMIRKGWVSPGTWGPVRAATADGKWLGERFPDGTWAAGHLPTCTEVKDGLRSLAAFRAYVGSGKAQADLERMQAGGGGDD